MTEDALLAEMRALQDRVTGITGTAVASRDGLIVRQDTGGVDPDNLAALAATWLALAQRMSTEARQGTLREAMVRSSGGYVTIYAVGARAVLVLIGDEGLDVSRLHRESQATLESIGALLADGAAQGNSHPSAYLRGGWASLEVAGPGCLEAADRSRSRDGGTAPARPSSPIPGGVCGCRYSMIAKGSYLIAIKSLRQEKSLRDHDGTDEVARVRNQEISGFDTLRLGHGRLRQVAGCRREAGPRSAA